MIVTSQYSPITVPSVDLWSFCLENPDQEFPNDHIVYVDVAAQRKFTFQEIRSTAERFGRGLVESWGWRKGDILALITQNSANVAAVTFGTLFAGGVVCPLNSLYTVSELVRQIQSCGSKAMVTDVKSLEVVCEAASIVGIPYNRILLIDEVDPKHDFKHFTSLQSKSKDFKRPTINPKEDLAFLVYSSGTTGLPKGVMLTHFNMVANLVQTDVAGEGFLHWKRDRSIGFLPMYHIYGISVLVLSPIRQGIATYIMHRFDLQAFCKVIEEERITFAYIVPPVALALAKSPVVDNYNLRSLRMLHSSAAPTASDVIAEIYRRLGVPTKQGYGLSEASPAVCSQSPENWDKPIGCSGRLGPSMRLKIMQNGKALGQKEEGEICIHGPNIFKGYYNNPEATAGAIDAEGWYRTGDIGYFDEHNNIYITDRVKELIKYNGFQVAPAQIESLLIAHPAVLDVAVIGVYSKERATELPRAYVVVASGQKEDENLEKKLHEWLNKQVAPYKRLRGGIRFVRAVPRSNAGKLLRRVLVEQARQEDKDVPVAVKARL